MKRIVFLVVIILAGIGLYIDTKNSRNETTETPVMPQSKKPAKERSYVERRDDATQLIQDHKKEVADKLVKVELTALQGRKLADLYAMYLGIVPGPVPPISNVSFEERMATMYNQKVNFKHCKKKRPDDCTVASDTVLNQAPDLLRAYTDSEKMKMDIKKFIAIADEKVVRGKKSIDWKALCMYSAYRLDDKRCSLLQAIVHNIQGKDMVAYGMTELLPTADGALNVLYTDILLRNAGAQFLYYVPALGDGLASLGFYQFTFLALREDGVRREGTNIVNTYVKSDGEKIPGSVVALSGHQHHTAAFYFAVHNIARFLSKINNHQIDTLRDIHNAHQDEMVIMVACAHHAPAATFPVVAKWLDVKRVKVVKKSKNQKATSREVDIVTMFPKKLDMRMYAEKSRNNLRAVYALK